MDGYFSSWTKTPAGTCVWVDPSLDSISAPTSPVPHDEPPGQKIYFPACHFLYISVHCLLVAVPLFVDLLNGKK
jgi:hypothetical protein